MTSVEQLYKLSEKLDNAGAKIGEHEADYAQILEGGKGDASAKKLTIQFIFRYFAKFPAKRDASLEALFSLCEDPDVQIRKTVVKDLPALCQEPGDHVDKILDILAQLLQSIDAQETQMVHNGLMKLINNTNYTKAAFKIIFTHISTTEDNNLRDKALRFLALKVRTLDTKVLTKEVEDLIFENAQKIMSDVTGDEFLLLMSTIQRLPHLQTVLGRKQVLDLVLKQAALDKKFDPSNADRVDQVTQCMKHAIPFLSKNVTSNDMLTYLFERVLPVLSNVCAVGTLSAHDTQLGILRVMAELTPYVGKMDDKYLDVVMDKCTALLPQPPAVALTGDATAAIDDATQNVAFSELECLLWTLHELCKRNTEYFNDASRADKFAAFKKQLTYFARLVQVYHQKLSAAMRTKTKADMATEQYKLESIALRTTENLRKIVLDFMKKSFNDVITLSWKTGIRKTSAPNEGNGNHAIEAPTTDSVRNGDDASAPKRRAITAPEAYKVPGGKYSDKVGQFKEANGTNGVRGGGSNRSRGGRGRGGRGRY